MFEKSARENRPEVEQFPCSEMFIITSRPTQESKRCMQDFYKMIVPKNFNHLIDVKFPCLKLTMTPVWPWHNYIHQ